MQKKLAVRHIFFVMSLFMGSLALAADNLTPLSGFLADYTRLVEKESRRGNQVLTYTNPEVTSRSVKKIFLMPVATYPDNAAFDQVDKSVTTQALAYLDENLRSTLAGRVTLVKSAEEADTTLQVVLTSLGTEVEGRKLRDLVPLRLITNPIKNAVNGKPMEAVATLELRIVDVGSQKTVQESVYHGVGKGIGRADDPKAKVSFKSVSSVLEGWVSQVSDEIAAGP